jgi:ABC-2 type transport system ATP-binding protein
MTVLDYLVFMGLLSGVNQLDAIARAIALLKKTDLNTFKDKNPNHLTPGMKTKIALIQALLPRPRLLLLDQPVEGMDQAAKSSILQLISELAVAEGMTVIITSSRWTDISPISEKMTWMHEGKVLLSGDARAIEELFELGIFSFQTSDNKRLLPVLQRLPYLKHIIIEEKDLITVITDESERLRKDLPGIIYKLELELTHFHQEEVTPEKLPYFLTMIQGD